MVDVAIVGGGPGGIATAIALRTVLPAGKTIKIYESRPADGEYGAFLGLDVHGLRALEAIHPTLAHRMYEVGSYAPTADFKFFSTGLPVPPNPHQPPPKDRRKRWEEHGHASVGMRWKGLLEVLGERLEQGALVHEHRLADCRELDPAEEAAQQQGAGEEPYRYSLTFEGPRDGPEQAAPAPSLEVRARVVVGADGYFSRVRRTLGDGAMPSFVGQVSWWGSATDAEVAAAGATWPEATNVGPEYEGQTRWYVFTPDTPRSSLAMLHRVVGGHTTWYFQSALGPLQAAGLEYEGSGTGEGARARLLSALSDMNPDLRSIVAATNPARISERGLHKHDWAAAGQGSWHRGHMVLVGDAAHASLPTGHGVNLAFEDAAVLGALVRQHGLTEKAFAEFEAARKERVVSILSDLQQPFLKAAAIALEGSCEPLWSPADLPVPVGSTEEGLAWSRRVVGEVLDRRLREQEAGQVAVPQQVPAAASAR